MTTRAIAVCAVTGVVTIALFGNVSAGNTMQGSLPDQSLDVHRQVPTSLNTTAIERPSLGRVTVPHPGALDPVRVSENIRQVLAQTELVQASEVYELSGDFKISRILSVRSVVPPPGFLVVEIQSLTGHPIASIAMMKSGEFLALEDTRSGSRGMSLELDDVSDRVHRRTGQRPERVEYVYFTNGVEPGFSMFRPMVAAHSPNGTIYMTSSGEAFTDASGRGEDAGRSDATTFPARAPDVGLRSRGVWP